MSGAGPVRDRLPEAADRHPRRLISNGAGGEGNKSSPYQGEAGRGKNYGFLS